MPAAIARTIRKDGMGDYTTFAAMIAELPADFTAYDEAWTVTVADSEEYAEDIAIVATMDATRNLVIQAAAGQHPVVKTSAANGVSITGGYTTWDGIDVRSANATTAIYLPTGASVARDCTVVPVSGRLTNGIVTAGNTGSVAVERAKVSGCETGIRLTGAGTIQNVVVRDVTGACVRFSASSTSLLHATLDPLAGDGFVSESGSGGTGMTIKNCIVRATGTGWRCIRQVDAAPYGSLSDFNTLEAVGGADVGRINVTSYATLAAWQAASGDDANSVDDVPDWVDEDNEQYALTASRNGEAGLGVTDDFIEMGRFDPADMGAFEYVPTLLMPSGVALTPGSDTAVNLAWTDWNEIIDASVAYEVYRAPDEYGAPGTYALIATTAAGVAHYEDSGLVAATTYWYLIRPVNAQQDGEYAYPAQEATTAVTPGVSGGGDPPDPPSGLIAVAKGSTTINLAWTDNSDNEVTFRVERAPDAGGVAGAYAEIGSTAAGVSIYEDTGRTQGTTYWYRVRARNANGDSAYATEASAATIDLRTPKSIGASGLIEETPRQFIDSDLDVVAGAAIPIYVPVYVGAADGYAYAADATNGTKMPALGFTVSGAQDQGYVCHVVIQGPVHYYGGFDLDPGQPVYVAAGGGITQTAPSTAGQVKQRLGWASADEAGGATTNRMIVNPGDAVEVEADVEEVAGSPVSRTGVDISSELHITSASQITLTEDAKYQIIFEGTGLAGGGDYAVRATVTRGGTAYEVIYDAVVTVSAGVTALYRASDTLALFNADVVRGYIDGLAGDLSVNVALRVVKMN